MGFYKDFGGLIMYLLCIINFILQFFFIYEISDEIDNRKNKILIFHKIINFTFLFFSIFSHIKTSIIDPGSITNQNNKNIIEFYYLFHEQFIKRALYITEKKTPEVIKNVILSERAKFKQNKENSKEAENEEEEEDKDNNDDDDNQSDKDDYTFEPVTSINDKNKEMFEEKYHLQLTRCKNCFVIRPINSHHCSVCHKCYINQDHHCPWVNNCVGLFNKKFFLLFLLYSFIEVIYSDFLFFYYTLYKNIDIFKDAPAHIILDVFAIVFGLILAIVSVMLLYDQYDTIMADCTQCDFKNGILLERSTAKQQFKLIFGQKMSFKWFLPFYSGGNVEIFRKIDKYLKIRESMMEKKKNNNDKDISKEANTYKATQGDIKDKYKSE